MPNWVPPLEHSETIEGCKCLHYNFSSFKDFTDLASLAAMWLVRRTKGGVPIQDPRSSQQPVVSTSPATSKQPQTARNKTEQATFGVDDDSGPLKVRLCG